MTIVLPGTKDMKRLIIPPLRKSIEIAYQSLKVRFFRSLVTTMSLVLAVAFLCYMSTTYDFAQGFLLSADPEAYQTLTAAGYDIGHGDQSIDASAKQKWIVFLSLLVCIVGIINAQLMSVTERFREIGTMKCLGALDRFVVRLFILEALIQGLAGSIAGAVLGVIFATLSSLINLGPTSVSGVQLGSLLLSMLIATATGTALSLAGVAYPAIIAARMQPVEAMRVEQ